MHGVGSGSGAEQTGDKTSALSPPFCSYLGCWTFKASHLHPSSVWLNPRATSAVLNPRGILSICLCLYSPYHWSSSAM